MIEKQDYIEPWRQQMPSFYSSTGIKYQDFSKRVCALRELFEETNMLFAKEAEKPGEEQPLIESYNNKFKTDFIKFSKACGIIPDIESMSGFHRVASPIGFHPTNDTQFYLYFQEDAKKYKGSNIENIILNQSEFTDYKWLSPDEALDMYQKSELPLFPPQILLLSMLTFLSRSYTNLKMNIVPHMQHNFMNYISSKMLFFNLVQLSKPTEQDPDCKELKRVLSQIFDESDLKSDSERDIHVWNNEVEMEKNNGLLAKLKQAKTMENIRDLCKNVTVGLWYGDFYSPNDNYPLAMERHQRRRLWFVGEWTKVLRVETSKKFIDKDAIYGSQIINTSEPKL